MNQRRLAIFLICFQLLLFSLVTTFWIGLGLGKIKIPTGVEGQWFEKIWDIMLIVLNVSMFSTAIKVADDFVW